MTEVLELLEPVHARMMDRMCFQIQAVKVSRTVVYHMTAEDGSLAFWRHWNQSVRSVINAQNTREAMVSDNMITKIIIIEPTDP